MAALIANLDLVIAADTAVAHLAGAIGEPTWVLLPMGDVWRWRLRRSDSYCYPTVRLFRQTSPLVWEPVIANLTQALRGFLSVIRTQRAPPFDSRNMQSTLARGGPGPWEETALPQSRGMECQLVVTGPVR